jgi:hypothetical protein
MHSDGIKKPYALSLWLLAKSEAQIMQWLPFQKNVGRLEEPFPRRPSSGVNVDMWK